MKVFIFGWALFVCKDLLSWLDYSFGLIIFGVKDRPQSGAKHP